MTVGLDFVESFLQRFFQISLALVLKTSIKYSYYIKVEIITFASKP